MKRYILGIVIFLIGFTVLLNSCDTMLLGEKLSFDGAEVIITAPVNRQAIDGTFVLKGSVSDRIGVEKLVVSANLGTENFPVQWQYRNSKWEVSLDKGSTWSLLPETTVDSEVYPKWTGDNISADWEVYINMNLAGDNYEDGQYQFTVAATNKSNRMGDKSTQTRNVILYKNPPVVTIVNPNLHDVSLINVANSDISKIKELSGNEWQDPYYIKKIINREFNLQWSIKEDYDIWALDIRLYNFYEADNTTPLDPFSSANEDEYI